MKKDVSKQVYKQLLASTLDRIEYIPIAYPPTIVNAYIEYTQNTKDKS